MQLVISPLHQALLIGPGSCPAAGRHVICELIPRQHVNESYLWQGRRTDHAALCERILAAAEQSGDITFKERAAQVCLEHADLPPVLRKRAVE